MARGVVVTASHRRRLGMVVVEYPPGRRGSEAALS